MNNNDKVVLNVLSTLNSIRFVRDKQNPHTLKPIPMSKQDFYKSIRDITKYLNDNYEFMEEE